MNKTQAQPMNQAAANKMVERKIVKGVYYPPRHKYRYVMDTNGEFLLGLEALTLLLYDMGK